MDFTSLYLRAFFGAKAFASDDLDALAERMDVSRLMSKDRRKDRYFITSAKSVTAANLGNKVVFGRSYYDRLSQQERVAVSAHEFAHMLSKDKNRRRNVVSAILVLSAVAALTVHLFSSSSVLPAECAFCASFLASMAIVSSKDAERSRIQEITCDSVAVGFVGAEHLLRSIRVAGAMVSRRSKFLSLVSLRTTRGRNIVENDNFDPLIEERATALLAHVATRQ